MDDGDEDDGEEDDDEAARRFEGDDAIGAPINGLDADNAATSLAGTAPDDSNEADAEEDPSSAEDDRSVARGRGIGRECERWRDDFKSAEYIGDRGRDFDLDLPLIAVLLLPDAS
jgi:hypothetical protein